MNFAIYLQYKQTKEKQTMKTTKEQAKEMVNEYNLTIYSSVSDIISAICDYYIISEAYIQKKDLCAIIGSITKCLIDNE